jgi:hypothetical protein
LAVPTFAWGPLGHRLSAQLAEPYLSARSQGALTDILGKQTLAEASVWADQMRGNPSPYWQQRAGAFHYVTVPVGQTYAEIGAPGKGDAVTALAEFRSTLADPAASLASKQMALRFSIHIVQDLHQPFHVGNGKDRGATRVKVSFDGHKQSLHWVWDTGLLNHAEGGNRGWREGLAGGMNSRWLNPDPLVWITESARVREGIYPQGATISAAYIQHNLPKVERRLQKSGMRTAAYLNEVFEQR